LLVEMTDLHIPRAESQINVVRNLNGWAPRHNIAEQVVYMVESPSATALPGVGRGRGRRKREKGK
jgi:hypothetical protein